MPLQLVPPRAGKSPNWTIRGTHLGVYVDRSSRTNREAVAGKIMRGIEKAIERGEYEERRPAAESPTFLSAAVAYMRAGGCRENTAKLISHFGERPLSEIDQGAIDAAALAIFPQASPATRNRKVYTPTSAILHHAGVEIALRRPKGARGRVRTDFLTPEDAQTIIAVADARDPPFGVLLRFLLYTGSRIGEAMSLTWENVSLEDGLVYITRTKNEDPRTVLLRSDLHAELAALKGSKAHGPVFDMARGGGLKDRLVHARMLASGVPVPKRVKSAPAKARRPPPHRLSWVTFHTFRHTFATWLRRYGQADLQGLVATGNWRDPRSASRYAHVVAREEWARVERLPAIRGKAVES